MNSRFALIHKKAQKTKLKNLKERKKNQISALFSTHRPPDDWPDAFLAIGLVANKFGKTSETLLLSQGLSYMQAC